MEIDHVGIAVGSIAEAARPYRTIAPGGTSAPEVVEGQGVRVAFVEVGGSHLELLEPLGPETPLGRFLARRGPGLHHIALKVESVDRALREVEASGGRLIDRQARPGARGRRVGFAHPDAFGGVLVEFVELP